MVPNHYVPSSSSSVSSNSTEMSSSIEVSSSSVDQIVSNAVIKPNPFNAKGDVIFDLIPGINHLNFSIYDMRGVKIKEFSEQNLRAGENQVWIKDGHQLNQGVYVLKIISNNRVVGSIRFNKN